MAHTWCNDLFSFTSNYLCNSDFIALFSAFGEGKTFQNSYHHILLCLHSKSSISCCFSLSFFLRVSANSLSNSSLFLLYNVLSGVFCNAVTINRVKRLKRLILVKLTKG